MTITWTMRIIRLLVSAAALVASLCAQVPVTSNGVGDFFPNLQRAIQLTAAQWERVADEGNTYQRFLAEKFQRLSAIDRELRIEQLRPTPDPMALGVRHVEIASICRESTDRQILLRQNLRKVLNAEQLVRLAQLEAGKAMLPAINEGQQILFLDTEVKEAANPFGDLQPGWRASRGFGELLPGCPQSGFGFVLGGLIAGDFSLSNRYPNLVRYLELTTDQVERIVEVNNRFGAAMGERQSEVVQIRIEMAAESQRAVPDPVVLGTKAARLEQICRESLAERAELRDMVPKLLTEAQRPRWQEMNRAQQLLPALSEAQEVNLGGPPASDALPPPYASDTPQRGPLEWNIVYSGISVALPGCEPGFASGRWFSTGSSRDGAAVPMRNMGSPLR
jgi:hypothetical protein